MIQISIYSMHYVREILDGIEIPGKFSRLWIHIESFFYNCKH